VRLRENLFWEQLDSGLEEGWGGHAAVCHQGRADGMELDSLDQLGSEIVGLESVEVGESPGSRAPTD